MNPGLVVKLRPAGPWRIGPDSGARNKVDAIYHSDSLYAAVTSAMARLGSLADWLDATARSATPEVCFSSCFPFLDEIGFVPPPRTMWPPSSPALMSARVRWKSARFVPLGIVQAILAGQRLDDEHWTVDGPSECLVPAGRQGPFRTGVRWNAAVDRLTGATERHSTACLEFQAGAGLWTVVSFRDEGARARWIGPVQAAFRWLADSGFGGERSRGWGRSEAPEFVEGTLPQMILGGAGDQAPAAVEEAHAAESRLAAEEQEASGAMIGEGAPVAPPVEEASEPAGGTADTGAAKEEHAAESRLAAEEQGASGAMIGEGAPVPPPAEEASEAAGVSAEAAPDLAAAGQASGESPAAEVMAPEQAETAEPQTAAAVEEPSPVPPVEEPPSQEPSPVPPVEEPPSEEPPVVPPAEEPPVTEPPAQQAAQRQAPEIAAMSAPKARAPEPPAAGHPHWLLSLFTPAADDSVDWGRGNYTLMTRSGRVEPSGELKKQLPMISEGSVVYAAAAPRGSAPDVAPDGFAHPVFRAGFAVSIPLPEVSV